MAVASSVILGAIGAAAAIAGTATTMKAAHDQKKASKKAAKAMQKQAEATPVYNEKKEIKKAADTSAALNRKRTLMETDTIRTSALGNTGGTQTAKKTLLGG